MILSLPSGSDDIIAFFHEKTVDMKGIGPVCQYARFDIAVANTEMFGTDSFIMPRMKLSPAPDPTSSSPSASITSPNPNPKTGKDSEMIILDEDNGKGERVVEILGAERDPKALRRSLAVHPESNDGKMEMSLINFKMKNKRWKPSDNDDRIQFVNSLSNSTQLRQSASFANPNLSIQVPSTLSSSSMSPTRAPQIVVDISSPNEIDEDLLHQSLIFKAFERRDPSAQGSVPSTSPASPNRKRTSSSGFS